MEKEKLKHCPYCGFGSYKKERDNGECPECDTIVVEGEK